MKLYTNILIGVIFHVSFLIINGEGYGQGTITADLASEKLADNIEHKAEANIGLGIGAVNPEHIEGNLNSNEYSKNIVKHEHHQHSQHHETHKTVNSGNNLNTDSEISLSHSGEINLENVDKAVLELQSAVKDIVASGGHGSFEVNLHSSGADKKCVGGVCNLGVGYVEKEILDGTSALNHKGNLELGSGLSAGQEQFSGSNFNVAFGSASSSGNVGKDILHDTTTLNQKEILGLGSGISAGQEHISGSDFNVAFGSASSSGNVGKDILHDTTTLNQKEILGLGSGISAGQEHISGSDFNVAFGSASSSGNVGKDILHDTTTLNQKEILGLGSEISAGQEHISGSDFNVAFGSASSSGNVGEDILQGTSHLNHKGNLESGSDLSAKQDNLLASHGGNLNVALNSASNSYSNNFETGSLNLGGHGGQLGAGLKHVDGTKHVDVAIGGEIRSISTHGDSNLEHNTHNKEPHSSIEDAAIISNTGEGGSPTYPLTSNDETHLTTSHTTINGGIFPDINHGINSGIRNEQSTGSVGNNEGPAKFPNFGFPSVSAGAQGGAGILPGTHINSNSGEIYDGYGSGSGAFGFGANSGFHERHPVRQGFGFTGGYGGQIGHGGFGGFTRHPGFEIGFSGFGAGNFPRRGIEHSGGINGAYGNNYGSYGGSDGIHVVSGMSLEHGASGFSAGNAGTHGTAAHITSNTDTHGIGSSDTIHGNNIPNIGGVGVHSTGHVGAHGIATAHSSSNAAAHSTSGAEVHGINGIGAHGAIHGTGNIEMKDFVGAAYGSDGIKNHVPDGGAGLYSASAIQSGEASGGGVEALTSGGEIIHHGDAIGGINPTDIRAGGKKTVTQHSTVHKTIHKGGNVIHKDKEVSITTTSTHGAGTASGAVGAHNTHGIGIHEGDGVKTHGVASTDSIGANTHSRGGGHVGAFGGHGRGGFGAFGLGGKKIHHHHHHAGGRLGGSFGGIGISNGFGGYGGINSGSGYDRYGGGGFGGYGGIPFNDYGADVSYESSYGGEAPFAGGGFGGYGASKGYGDGGIVGASAGSYGGGQIISEPAINLEGGKGHGGYGGYGK